MIIKYNYASVLDRKVRDIDLLKLNPMRKHNGQFGRGNSGRPKGTPNKATSERKAKLNAILQKIEDEHLDSDLGKLSSRDRVKLYADLLEYTIPKLTREERPPTELEELLAMSPEDRKAEIIKIQGELKNKN